MIDCRGCGAVCCKNVAHIINYALSSNMPESCKEEYRRFPHGVSVDGACEILAEDGTCPEYNRRPVMCNSQKFHELHIVGISFQGFKGLISKNCEKIQKAFRH